MEKSNSLVNQEIGIDKKLWDAMIEIMTGFEVESGFDFLEQSKILDRIYSEVIDVCPTFTGEEKKKYSYLIDSIKDIMNEIIFSNKSIEEKKGLCVQKAEYIGKLPSAYEIRHNVIRITTIPELENTELLG